MQLLTFALPGGFLGGVFTWIFSRRKQDNDFLKELQSSIDMLVEVNKKVLEENIQLRRENIYLKTRQEAEQLRKAIGKRTSYEDNTLFSAARRASGGLRTDEELGHDRNGHPGRHRPARASPRTGHHRADDAGSDDLAVGGDLGTAGSALGGDTSTDGLGDGNGGEPP